MYELIRVSEHDYYLDCPAKIGIVLTEAGAVLIDSGSDKDAGKKALRALETNGWKLAAIYNTHAHADHIGGNRLLQDRTGCRIFARGVECAMTNHPILEPVTLFGAFPYADLRHKFLLAQESRAEPLTQDVLPAGMTMLELPGHSFDMTGFRTPDGTVYLGDCLCAEQTLEKYGVSFLWDVGASLRTLETVEKMEAACFVPSHAPACTDIAPLARKNAEAIRGAADVICGFCREPADTETLLQRLFTHWGLTMNAQQHALVGSTLRSYLSWLAEQGRVCFSFEDNRMLWKIAETA